MKQLRDFYPWLEKNGIPLPDTRQETKLERFLDLLLNWNRKISLTADNNRETLLTRHLLDSLTPLAVKANDDMLADIGSGTGFPAIPLAVMLPGKTFFLIEKVARKCAFLKMLVRRLDLPNVHVVETLLGDWNPATPVPAAAITRAVRVDNEFKNQLFEKGLKNLLCFSSRPTENTIFEYQLPAEQRNRYLDSVSIG
ncbi:MAG: 16S rRNA (guanine(527)-N(7))-methyltransferase RsmG [Acidobacteria bacterium]|nr:16S rRNA (guanine(527)-N(7))-methyltransferase RsmG [Acidobacteriota bacterium]